jgi:beta-glucosidase-like glycosyl hydrolase
LAKAIACEVKENNIGIWLAPALNIHRNPRCGRNFEYYSEDPLSSGYFASACVKAVQSMGIAATVKHYCANNREHNRRYMDSRVSQRALREIYLKGFEIVVKKAKPWALMTSYNPVNGVQMSANSEAINGILRNEWHYDGVVMTDWRTLSNIDEELLAGGDVKMPEPFTSFYKNADPAIDPVECIRSGKTVCCYTTRALITADTGNKEDDLRLSVRISDAVQSLVGRLTVTPAFVIAKGGITSSDVGTKALAVKKANVLGQIRPGIPVWQTGDESTFPKTPYVIFPGNVGEATTLKEAVEILLAK